MFKGRLVKIKVTGETGIVSDESNPMMLKVLINDKSPKTVPILGLIFVEGPIPVVVPAGVPVSRFDQEDFSTSGI